MGKGNGKKRHAVAKNIAVTIGCTLFAGAYAFGGCYLVNELAGRAGELAVWVRTEGAPDGPEAAEESMSVVNGRTEQGDIDQEPRFKGNDKGDGSPSVPGASGTKETEEETETEEEKDTEKERDTRKEKGTEEETEEDTDRADQDAAEEEESRKERRDRIEVDHVEAIAQDAAVVVADVTAVVKTAMPCVVAITNEYTAYDYWYDEEVDEQINGSGIIVSQSEDEILIVTNYHVIEDSENLYVQFIDDAEAVAYVKGTSPDNDLAIVSVFLEDIKDETLKSIAIAALGDSDSLEVGEPAIAIGNSLGYGQSVTTGVISALNRDIFADDPDISQGYLIQTDAAINPGNSGGALLNVNGEVVGINSSKIADYVIEGMGYAIPISTAKPVIDDLMKMETRKKVPEEQRAFLGISGTDVTEEAVERYDMPEGAYVSDVLEDTAAEEAGLLKGDIITYIDREPTASMSELQEILQYYAAGTQIELTVMRRANGEYKEMKIRVTLGGQ